MEENATTSFADLGLQEKIVAALTGLGYEAPTPIQAKTIPILLGGNDLIGQAQTGTGKTAAFALPILARLDPAVRETQALILAPTRELAMQVAEAFHSYSKQLGTISVLPVYGGAPIYNQMKHLARGAQIVVGTPGRLIDHLERETLKLDSVRMVVLDEADEMLKMGFIDDVEKILSKIPKPRQIALFSATMPPEVVRVAERHLSSPSRVEVERKEMTAPKIDQRFINVAEGQKLDVLTQMLELEEADAVLIFRRTKTGAAELAEKLEARGFAAVAMHGDMNQTMRENVIRRLRLGQIEIVVATDVAARGLDVEQISHVVNYDIPYDVEAYVHRIGRTGRAGRAGVATLFVTPRERRMMRDIERFTGAPIQPMRMPTIADVAARRVSVFKDLIKTTLAGGDLDLYVQLIQEVAEEGPFDTVEVAAAAAKLAATAGGRSLVVKPAPSLPEPRFESRSTPSRGPVDRGSAPPREDDDEPKVRLSMAVGKMDGIRPADVVGSIANEADIPGREIGPIDIRDEVTYVTIPARHVDVVLAKVARAKFRGRPVNLKVATEGDVARRTESARPKPPFAREGAPRRPYDRDAAPRERKPYDRDAAPRERKPFDRDAAPRERKPFDRDAAPRERKPYDRSAAAPARKPYDRDAAPRERKPFDRDAAPATRKPYSRDAAPAGRKPFRNDAAGERRGGAFAKPSRPSRFGGSDAGKPRRSGPGGPPKSKGGGGGRFRK